MLKYYKNNDKECLIYTFKYGRFFISINYETFLMCEGDNVERRIFTNINDFDDITEDMKLIIKYNAITNLSGEMVSHEDRDSLILLTHNLIFDIQNM